MRSEAKYECDFLFDEYRIKKCPNYSFEWEYTTDPIDIKAGSFICEGVLHSCSEKLQNAQHYILTLDKLIACNASHSTSDTRKSLNSENCYLPLSNPLLRKFVREKKFGVRLVANGKTQDFLCSSKEEMQRWFESFKAVAVLEHIEENYHVGEIIGTGSSATVRSAKKINSKNQEYAIKSIPKKNYAEKHHSLVYW